MAYQEALIVCKEAEDFRKVCEVVSKAYSDGRYATEGIHIVELGKLKKRIGRYLKGSSFIWLTGNRGKLRDLNAVLGEEDSNLLGISKNVEICLCDELPVVSMLMDLKTIKVVKDITISENNLVLLATLKSGIPNEVVEFIANRKI